METKEQKKDELRGKIIQAAEIYSRELSGKIFLYVAGSECFEVLFKTDHFLHLTGVCTYLSASEFYKKSKDQQLTLNQFYFNKDHPFRNAQKKLKCLYMLPALTNQVVCVLKDMNTVTITYKLGITNLDFTLGLTENINKNGDKVNDWFLPQTLRIKDKAIENSQDAEFVDFIFMREATKSKYDAVMYADPTKKLPENIIPRLSDELCASFNTNVVA